MFLKHGYNRYQTDYLKEVMFNAWFDRAQKLKKNDIFDMLCAGCLGYKTIKTRRSYFGECKFLYYFV